MVARSPGAIPQEGHSGGSVLRAPHANALERGPPGLWESGRLGWPAQGLDPWARKPGHGESPARSFPGMAAPWGGRGCRPLSLCLPLAPGPLGLRGGQMLRPSLSLQTFGFEA